MSTPFVLVVYGVSGCGEALVRIFLTGLSYFFSETTGHSDSVCDNDASGMPAFMEFVVNQQVKNKSKQSVDALCIKFDTAVSRSAR